MAFSELPDRSAGDAVTVAMWDAVKGNLNAGVMRPIAKSVLASSAASVTFSGIAADWMDLLLVVRSRSTSPTAALAGLRFNSDTTANYNAIRQYAAASIGGFAQALQTQLEFAGITPSSSLGHSPGYVWIHDYKSSGHKCVTFQYAFTGGGASEAGRGGGVWRSTAVIDTVTVVHPSASFAAGSSFYLYGIAGV